MTRTVDLLRRELLLKLEKFTTLQRSLLAAICVVYVLVRFWGFGSSCLWFDEIFSVNAAGRSWGEMSWFVAQDVIHPPLFYAVLRIWITLGGESLLWLRSLSVSISILAVVPFLYLCRELRLKFATIGTALILFSVNGSLIKYAQEVRMYGLLLFLSLVSLWLFSRFYFRGKNIWVLTVVNILLIYTHYFGWFVVASQVMTILVFQRIKMRHVLVMLGIAAASFVPWVLIVGKALRGGADVSQNIGWIERPTLRSIFDVALDVIEPFYFQQSSIDASSLFYISIPLLVLVAAAIITHLFTVRNQEDNDSYFLLWMFVSVPVVIAFTLSCFLPVSVWGSRHLIIVFPPAIILAAMFITGVSQKWIRNAFFAATAALVITAFVLRAMAEQPIYIWCAWDKFAGDLKTTDTAGETLIYTFEDLVAYHMWFALRDSGKFRIIAVKGIGGLTEDTAYFLPRGFDYVEKSDENGITGDRFWIVYRAESFDRNAAPLMNIERKGYHLGEPKVIEAAREKAFLVEARKQP